MAANMGIKLAAEGEKEFRDALKQITAEYKVLTAEAKLNEAQFDKNDTSIQKLSSRNADLQASVEKQKEKVELLRAAVEKTSLQYGKSDQRTLKWKESLAKAETQLTGLQQELGKNNEELKKHQSVIGQVKDKLGDWKAKIEELKDNHEHLTKGLSTVGKAAGSLAKGGLKLLGGAAVGAVAGVAAIGAAAVKAGKELGQLMIQAAEAGDTIDDESQKIGVSAEKYQVLSYQAELSGTSIQTISKAAAKLKSAGSDMNVDEAIKKLAAIKDPAERSAAAIEMFGAKTAQELTPLLNQGTEGLKAMEQAARDNGMIMSNEAVAAASQFNDSLATMKDTASAVKNNLVAELLPGATTAIEGLTGLLAGDEGAAEKIKSGVNDMIASFKEMVPKAIEIVKTLAGAVLEVAPDIVIALADGIIDTLPEIVDAAVSIVQELTQGLLTEDNIQKVMRAAVGLVNSLVRFLAENVSLLVDSAFLIVDELVSGLADPKSMKELVNSALMIIEKLSTGLLDNLPELLSAAWELAKALGEAIIDYDWWSLAKSIFASLKGGIKKLLSGEKDADTDDDAPAPKQPNGRHASGLKYVPYDGYYAELHKGERVLTAYENRTYTSGSAETTYEVRALRQELAAMRDDMRRYGMPVNVNNWRQGRRELRV